MAKKDNYHAAASSGGGAVYGIGLIGAFIFYMQEANNFWEVIVGTLQALVWPAYVVYNLLESFYR